jgi:hypothetical protein
MLKPILPLRPHRQHKHGVDSRHIAVQRYITARGAADDQFAFSVFHRSPNLGAVGQDLDGFQNVANTPVAEQLVRAIFVSDGASVGTYLQVFKNVFYNLKHDAHYRMMMREDELEPVQIASEHLTSADVLESKTYWLI